jgi:tRNA threonylcarbamoyladenosine biosynthesis protein TsaB
MRLLAIETSGKTGEFAVLSGGEVLAEAAVDAAGRLVERGVGEIEAVLARAGVALGDLDAVAVSMGPGSFTGLRVGMAIAKGLCFHTDTALVGVPTLDAIAEAQGERAGFTVPVMDARRGEIYLGIYRADGPAVTRLSEYLALKPDAAVNRIRRECASSPVLLAGDAITAYKEILAAGLGSGVEFAPEEVWRVRAAVVGRIGLSLLSEGKVLDAAKAEPMYIRPSEAERKAGRG